MVYVLKAWWCSMAMLNQMVTLQKLWKPNHRTSSSPTKNWNCPHLSGVCFHSYRTSNCTSGRKYQFIKCPISCMATSARRRKVVMLETSRNVSRNLKNISWSHSHSCRLVAPILRAFHPVSGRHAIDMLMGQTWGCQWTHKRPGIDSFRP